MSVEQEQPSQDHASKDVNIRDLSMQILDDNKAIDLKDLDVSTLTSITSHMLICTASSNRHASALADKVIRGLRDHGVRPLGIEGIESGEWILVDFGDVVVHIMQAAQRQFYDLEKLWRATEMARQQHDDHNHNED